VPTMINEAYQVGATQVFNKATLTPRQILDALYTALEGDVLADSGEAGGATASARTDGPAGTAVATQKAIEEEVDGEVIETFNGSAQDTLALLRKTVSEFTKGLDESARVTHLLTLYRKVHGLTGSAGLAGLHNISQLASALEVLLKELYDKPKNINASTLRTVAHSIDFLFELFQKAPKRNLLDQRPVEILVVDDEILSRRAVTYALEKAGLKAASMEDPQAALKLAGEKRFDLIFLDVQMPGIDGFELCTKLRALPTHKATPIIFVTNLSDFKSRAKSTLSGGNDFIAKPFMFIELSVKALTYVMRGRLAETATPAA